MNSEVITTAYEAYQVKRLSLRVTENVHTVWINSQLRAK